MRQPARRFVAGLNLRGVFCRALHRTMEFEC